MLNHKHFALLIGVIALNVLGCDDETAKNLCGNGQVDAGEQCDLGRMNGSVTSGCSEMCKLTAYCGDGIVQSELGEACDLGTNSAGISKNTGVECTPDCQLPKTQSPYCGDGHQDVNEACDHGPANGHDGVCNADCSLVGTSSYCGDGHLDDGEACDHGPANGHDGVCNADCSLVGISSYCGDGHLDDGEACDNGSANGHDGVCNADCSKVVISNRCGDGHLDDGEACDNGSANGHDGVCNADCSKVVISNRCGDGHLDDDEACDDGVALNTGAYGGCTADCTLAPFCGDSTKDAVEECDHGAQNGVDGLCTEECKLIAPPECGNGIKEGGEECDEGFNNGNRYNGCTPECKRGPYCGDGVPYPSSTSVVYEECDDGPENTGGYGKCTSSCTLDERCGDGITQFKYGEMCDDGAKNGTSESDCTENCLKVSSDLVVMTDPGEHLFTNEFGYSMTVRFYLSEAPTEDVTIRVDVSDATEASVSPDHLTFTPEDYSTPQTVTITGLEDDVADGDQQYQVSFSVASTDTRFDQYELESLDIQNIDKDVAPGSKLKIRFMAANTTSGNYSSYEEPGIRIFQAMKPDIVMLNEFNSYTDTVLKTQDRRAFVDAAFGPEYYYATGAYSTTSSGKCNGFVSRWPIVETGYWYSNITSIQDRAWDWAIVDLPGDRDLLVVSVHLHTSDNGQEMPVLAQRIAEKMEGHNYYFVMGGDFNTKNRNAAVTNFSSIAVVGPNYPVDQKGSAATNLKRAYPYDWVIMNEALDQYEVPVVIGQHSYPDGHVFDSRVYDDLGELDDVVPVQAGDSKVNGMQHMPVIRDVELPF